MHQHTVQPDFKASWLTTKKKMLDNSFLNLHVFDESAEIVQGLE